ncbi:MAG: hypothetical protein ACREU2_09950 [Steroidobacteraceae bacterium]
MARIPDFTSLGMDTPQPQLTPRIPTDESGNIIGQGAAELSQSVKNAGDLQYAQKQRMLAAQGENAVLDHRLAVENLAQQTSQSVADGSTDYNTARAQFDQQVGKIPVPTFGSLAAPVAASLTGETQRNITAAGFTVDNAVNQARKDDFKDQFGQGLDKLGKLAGMPGADVDSINQQADVFRPLARSAGLPQAFVDQTLQTFKDNNWYNQATQRAMQARENPQALEQLGNDLTDQNGFYAGRLDANKRDALLRTVQNDQLVLQNRAERDSDKQEAKAAAAMNQVNEQIASGVPATPAMWDNWATLTKGTSVEGDFDQAQKDEQTVQQVLREPIDQQQAYVQQRAAALDQGGGTLRDRADLIRLQTAVNQNVNLLQKAPLLYDANRTGTEPTPVDFSGLGDPQGQQQIGATLADRMTTLTAMRKQYGPAVQTLPLLPQEANAVTSQLDGATPTARAQLLVGLRQAIPDDATYQAVLHQVAPHSPVTAIAGELIGATSPGQMPVWYDHAFAPQMLDVQRILRGEALLNPASAGKQASSEQESGDGAIKTGMPMPRDDGFSGLRMAFGHAAGDMFRDRPQLADAYYSVFKDAEAALLAEKGDMRGVGGFDVEKQALQIALGNRVTFNDHTYSVPRGMDPSRFKGLVQNAVASTAQQLNAPADWQQRIRGYQLRELGSLGSGRYMLTNGSMPLVRPDGSGPFIINLRDQYSAGAATNAQGAQ